jgi:hypothetical protein
VSVRLPTGSCQRACWYCCKDSWRGGAWYGAQKVLTGGDFLRLWEKIFKRDDWRYVWPLSRIRERLEKKKVLRFVREDLFEPSISGITRTVLETAKEKNIGLLIKSSSLFILNFVKELREIKHVIIFTCNNLLPDYKERITAISWMVKQGLNITLSLKPIKEYDEKVAWILENAPEGIIGVEVGWLNGPADWIPRKYLRKDYRAINRESQYDSEHLQNIVSKIMTTLQRRKIKAGFYFSSRFAPMNSTGACCLADVVL